MPAHALPNEEGIVPGNITTVEEQNVVGFKEAEVTTGPELATKNQFEVLDDGENRKNGGKKNKRGGGSHSGGKIR